MIASSLKFLLQEDGKKGYFVLADVVILIVVNVFSVMRNVYRTIAQWTFFLS